LICSSCATDNEADRKFCKECGKRLATGCPACGAPNAADAKFCGECGASIASGAPVTATSRQSVPLPPDAPAAERRLVSILFADLVGFTTLAEGRDAEETRELLSRYFDLSRDVIARYGGGTSRCRAYYRMARGQNAEIAQRARMSPRGSRSRAAAPERQGRCLALDGPERGFALQRRVRFGRRHRHAALGALTRQARNRDARRRPVPASDYGAVVDLSRVRTASSRCPNATRSKPSWSTGCSRCCPCRSTASACRHRVPNRAARRTSRRRS
jgi:Double zinc ribbon